MQVLGAFVPRLIEFHNEKYGEPHLELATFHSYHFSDVWGGTDDAAMDKVEAFFASPYFLGGGGGAADVLSGSDGIPVLPGAREALRALHDSGRFSFVLVTSRQHELEDETRRWLDAHFAGVFDKVVFGNHYGRDGAKKSKPDMCRELGARALIDDRVQYCEQCADAVDLALLFGTYAWNTLPEGKELPTNVVRCLDWAETKAALERMADAAPGAKPSAAPSS